MSLKLDKLKLIYGDEVALKITSSNVLVVGAGGIGCELMKTLSMTGFKKITIIDLDTIDVSNLNRQFLFRREHVDKSKAEVVRDQIKKQNPNIEVEAFVGRIQEERFGFKFFSEFDIVINALDNEEARKHVNNMCFNLNIPLVDSGTNGYAAQCIPICKYKTPCYQCVERPKDQSFPVCTIRQKPEKLIHCIVWAKALFEGLFGPKENSNNIIQDIVEEIQSMQSDSSDKIALAQVIFNRVFTSEVKTLFDNLNARLSKMETPVGVSGGEESKDQEDLESDREFLQKIKIFEFTTFIERIKENLQNPDYNLNKETLQDELSLKVLSVEDYVYSFVKAIIKIYEERKEQIGSLVFNKDDELIIDFVTAATNIRASNFSIPMESKFKIKEMAGKIIPAISSSNALVASLQVLESIKILAKQYDQIQGIVYQRLDQQRLQSFKRINDDPSPDCQICRDDSKFIFTATVKDLKIFKLSDLVKALMEDFQLSDSFLIEFNNDIIYEQGPDIDEDDLEIFERRCKKSLQDLKFRDLSIFQVSGSFQGSEQESSIYVQLFEEPGLLEKTYEVKLLKKGQGESLKVQDERRAAEQKKAKEAQMLEKGDIQLSDDDEDGLIIEENSHDKKGQPVIGQKRPPEDAIQDLVEEMEAKRQKLE